MVEVRQTPVEVGEKKRGENVLTEIQIWEANMKRKVSTQIASVD